MTKWAGQTGQVMGQNSKQVKTSGSFKYSLSRSAAWADPSTLFCPFFYDISKTMYQIRL